MYMILRYDTGRRVEAVLLSATRERIKVVIRDQDDTLELDRLGDRWMTDSGSEFEIESILSDDTTDIATIWPEEARTIVASAVS